MNPLSNNSCNFSFSYFSSIDAILHATLAIRIVPEMRSIKHYVPQSRGKPDSTLGNISWNYLAIGIDSNYNSSF